MRQDTQYKNNL